MRASIENPCLGSQGWKMNGAGTREAPGRSRRAAEVIWARDWRGPEQGCLGRNKTVKVKASQLGERMGKEGCLAKSETG